MNQQTIDYTSIQGISTIDNAYIAGDAALQSLYKYDVAIDSFAQVFEDKAKQAVDRKTLKLAVEATYEGLTCSELQLNGIAQLLDENTYTVTTAHQPCLLTGPLYIIYKIGATINLARQLNERYPDKTVIPIFWSGGEDHDFEEMNNLTLYGKTVTWENDEAGSVGKFSTNGLAEAIAQVKEILGERYSNELIVKELDKLSASKNYGASFLQLIHFLFKDTELLLLNADNQLLKRSFSDVIHREIFTPVAPEKIAVGNEQLTAAGYNPQAFVRPINLFYRKEGMRARIEQTSEQTWQVVGTAILFSKADLVDEIAQHPERFSPNVNLRPLYQEFILPNLAYIGGGGEIAYWLQQKSLFEHYEVNYPMLIRRNSVQLVTPAMQKKADKLDISVTDLLTNSVEAIKKSQLDKLLTSPCDLSPEQAAIQTAFEGIIEKTKAVDKSKSASFAAQLHKLSKSINDIAGKVKKIEKEKHSVTLNQVEKLYTTFNPSNKLQERKSNFLEFYFMFGGAMFVKDLIDVLDPMNKAFLVLSNHSSSKQ